MRLRKRVFVFETLEEIAEAIAVDVHHRLHVLAHLPCGYLQLLSRRAVCDDRPAPAVPDEELEFVDAVVRVDVEWHHSGPHGAQEGGDREPAVPHRYHDPIELLERVFSKHVREPAGESVELAVRRLLARFQIYQRNPLSEAVLDPSVEVQLDYVEALLDRLGNHGGAHFQSRCSTSLEGFLLVILSISESEMPCSFSSAIIFSRTSTG